MATVKERFDGNTNKIDKAILDLKRELPQRTGQYVWEKLISKGGAFIEYVTADNRDSYPENGTQDGYYYKLVENIPYEGDNPLTLGASGYTFPAKTLFEEDLQIINGVNGEDLTETASAQGTAVANLLKMVNRKVADHKGEGAYVWKKCRPTKITLTNPTITLARDAGQGYDDYYKRLYSDKFNPSNVDITFFEGFTTNSGVTFTRSGDNILYGSTVCSYDPNTHWLYGIYGLADLTATYNGIKEVDGDLEFVNYVVSADETAYPNCGMLDGYWYELIEETFPLEYLGITDWEFQEITFSSRTNALNAIINTKGIPRLIYGEVDKYPSYDDIISVAFYNLFNEDYASYASMLTTSEYSNGYNEGRPGLHMEDDKMRFYDEYKYFAAGATLSLFLGY